MEPIAVPAPPKSAFNKNRRVSDLLHSQVRHFQHVAHKQGIRLDPAIERDIATEAGAARYIASITQAMRKPTTASAVVSMPSPAAGQDGEAAAGLTLAAGADSAAAPAKKGKRARKGSKAGKTGKS